MSERTSTDAAWTRAGSPYVLTGAVCVQGADGADGLTTLTIHPGVISLIAHAAGTQCVNSANPALRKSNFYLVTTKAGNGKQGTLDVGTSAERSHFTPCP